MLKPQTNRCRALLELEGLGRSSFNPRRRGGEVTVTGSSQ